MSSKIKALNILFEDDDLILVNKPSGIPVIPERGNNPTKDLQSLLETKYSKIWIVHRIDKETSGIVCFAKHEEAHKRMNKLFQDQSVEKKYWAIVQGSLKEKEGQIDAPIMTGNKINRINPKGKKAMSYYKLLETFKGISLVELQIITGRQHQIRLHMRSIGHPLLVDSKYSKTDAFYLSTIKKGRYRNSTDQERPLLNRLSLHARSIKFKHPFKDEIVELQAELPKDLKATLNQLRKWNY